MLTPEEIEAAAERIRSSDPAEIKREARKNHEKVVQDFEEFKKDLSQGTCMICKKPMNSFSRGNPCLHWLTKPKGFKKKNFPEVFEKYSFGKIAAYARWLAAIESPLRNINDLRDEHPSGKMIDFTARYKHLTWSFSCGEGDFEGHKEAKSGSFPHYHMQMRVSGMQFINYNDFHIPFHEDDHAILSLNRLDPTLLAYNYGIQTGIQSVFDSQEAMEEAIEHCRPTEDPENSAFHVQTFVEAKPGERLSGDELAQMIEEAKSKNKSIASMARERFEGRAQVGTIISPSEGVVQALPRSPRKKKDNHS